jgi:acetyltransferase-like isoleucine patch superfamily enzyme
MSRKGAGPATFVHESAAVDRRATLGEGTRVWNNAQVREGARIGRECVIGSGAYIDAHVRIGDRVKIENGALVFSGARIDDGAFIGPHACLANDRRPRAVTPEGTLKTSKDWRMERVHVERGASLGAQSVIVPPATIGSFALVAAGAVVLGDVPAHAIVAGNPARTIGRACKCGARLRGARVLRCDDCGRRYRVAAGVVSEAGS